MQPIPYINGQTGILNSQQQQSTTQAVNSLDFAYQNGVDANGWVNQFSPGNVNCTLLRVGATGTTPPSQTTWTASNTKLSHNLGVQPTGWIIVYSDKAVTVVAGTTDPDTQFMYLTVSDDTANVTLLMF